MFKMSHLHKTLKISTCVKQKDKITIRLIIVKFGENTFNVCHHLFIKTCKKLLPKIVNQSSYLWVLSLYPGLNGLGGRLIIIKTDNSEKKIINKIDYLGTHWKRVVSLELGNIEN
jgi:hypothetical protein